MSKKMKGVAFDSSPHVSYEDARARFKHQTLLQDYRELEQVKFVLYFVFDLQDSLGFLLF